MLGVHTVADEMFSGGGFALGDFVFVMGEGEIDAAGVDVDCFAEILHGHGGALDVPAGAAAANGRVPEMFAGLGSFPEGEIAGTFLFVAVVIHAGAGLDAAYVNFGELAIVGKFGDAVVDGAFAGVGVGFFLEALDQLDHGIDVVRGADPVIGGFDAESFAIVEEGLDEFLGVITDAEVLGGGVGDDAIVDVGEIHYVSQAKAAEFQEAAENVLEDEGAVVADVGVIVDGGAAGVHGDFAGFFGDEGLGLVGERVVEVDFGHGCGDQLTASVDGGIFWRERNDDCIRGWEENKQGLGGEPKVNSQ